LHNYFPFPPRLQQSLSFYMCLKKHEPWINCGNVILIYFKLLASIIFVVFVFAFSRRICSPLFLHSEFT
jgi:hypothetical protein